MSSHGAECIATILIKSLNNILYFLILNILSCLFRDNYFYLFYFSKLSLRPL